MSKNVISEIKKLIAIVENGQMPNEEFSRNFLFSLRNNMKIKMLSFDELVFLMRAVNILEESIKPIGSTTVMGCLLEALESKDGGREKDIINLLNWLLSHRTNPYVPFGRSIPLNIKSMAEYEKYETEKYEHRKRMIANDELKSIEAKRKRVAHVLMHKKLAQKKHEERVKIIKKLQSLSTKNCIIYIMRLNKPIYYFPEEFAEITHAEFDKLPQSLLEKLVLRISGAKRGSKWIRLRRKLVLYLENNASNK